MAKSTPSDNYKIFAKAMKIFLKFCQEELNLESLPKIEWLTTNLNDSDQPSFGGFNPNDGSIRLEIMNRHPLDIMRTLAHELVHYKQHLNGELHPSSGETGSKHENWANSIAGIIMRKFGKKYPGLYKCKPITD
jgi:Zn-dependent peptidase ImmA (M78 family)